MAPDGAPYWLLNEGPVAVVRVCGRSSHTAGDSGRGGVGELWLEPDCGPPGEGMEKSRYGVPAGAGAGGPGNHDGRWWATGVGM